VLLTDGLPNQVPYGPGSSQEQTVLAKADHAKAADPNMVIYTIGVGAPTDLNQELLTQCATKPENYFYQANADDLADVYSAIAYSFGCPARHDWGKPWE
jgi:hypothetical protein